MAGKVYSNYQRTQAFHNNGRDPFAFYHNGSELQYGNSVNGMPGPGGQGGQGGPGGTDQYGPGGGTGAYPPGGGAYPTGAGPTTYEGAMDSKNEDDESTGSKLAKTALGVGVIGGAAYGATKLLAGTGVGNWIGGAASNAFGAVTGAFKSGGVVSNAVGAIGNTGVGKWVVGAAGSVKSAAMSVFHSPIIGAPLRLASTVGKAVLGTVGGWIGGGVGTVMGAIGAVAGPIGLAIAGASLLGGLVEKIPVIGKPLGFVLKLPGKIVGTVVKGVINVGKAIVKGVASVAKSIGGAVVGFFKKL